MTENELFGNVLLVGAGGLGCEAIKNLSTLRIQHLTVIDMDRTDPSNLNRQFLYTKEDVGNFKSYAATKAYEKYTGRKAHAFIRPIQEYPVEEFKKHDIIISALDNVKARKHLNRLCIAHDKPLVEAGSTGYAGQAYIIWGRAGTACYDCSEKPSDSKTFPVCTIRNSPSKPEHCIAWAQFIVDAMLGDQDDSDYFDKSFDLTFSNSDDSKEELFKKIFNYLFTDRMKELIMQESLTPGQNEPKKLTAIELSECCDRPMPTEYSFLVSDEMSTKPSSLKSLVHHMYISLMNCLSTGSPLCFNKNDEDLMQLVHSLAGIRMFCFAIPQISLWDCKTIAGNIQPAIASTNTIVSGIQMWILERALSLIKSGNEVTYELLQECGLNFFWIRTVGGTRSPILVDELPKQDPKCLVCCTNINKLYTDKDLSVNEFLDLILKECSIRVETIQTDDTIIYDIDMEPETEGKTIPYEIVNVVGDGECIDIAVIAGYAYSYERSSAPNMKLSDWTKMNNSEPIPIPASDNLDNGTTKRPLDAIKGSSTKMHRVETE